VDVAGEGDLELPGGEVPELDGSVCGAWGEEGVAGGDCEGAHPALVASNYSVKFVGGVPGGFDQLADGVGADCSQFGGLHKVDL
jgi:hypothetical protein